MENKNIKKANLAGFCYGVKRAIDLTTSIKQENPDMNVFTFGELIHNNQVIENLEKLGIKVIHDVNEITNPENSICVIRTHGATPQDINKIREKGCKILDATCVDVKKVQEKAKSLIEEGYKLIIIGKINHPEVIGIKAHAEENSDEKSIVLASVDDIEEHLEEIKSAKKIGIVIQTTQKTENLQKILAHVAQYAKELKVYNTICKTTSNRQKEAKALAKEVDLMIVVGSKTSANTSHLAEILSEITTTIHIETEKEIDNYKELIEKAQNIGVTAGASTPEYIITNVIDTIKLKGEI
ncbi:MAG: 4-hydroxy-3-methylbut-2-enyl diphosphate reductase [Candidatus Gastranaerophilales bacterium]|nr:4-hydroxy-3-methylbut-2-enyl diphosphate reductase [Candidatus Gastranaerophilales bacterium]